MLIQIPQKKRPVFALYCVFSGSDDLELLGFQQNILDIMPSTTPQ